MQAKRMTLCAMLTAIALVLSVVEKWIPLTAVIPIPGIKLGLANIITLFALKSMSKKETAVILLARVTMGSLFLGSVTGFIFGICGGFLALGTMALLLRRENQWFSLYGISIAGAAAHNIGQIAAAIFWLGTVDVIGYLPLLLIMAIPMGFLTGLVSTVTFAHLQKIKIL